MVEEQNTIIELKGIGKSFPQREHLDLTVLQDVNLALVEGEIVAILGKSGSGKSTLLQIISGLSKPSEGEALYRGNPILGPSPGIAMVFQHFALMPWLTVLENVELGLLALGISKEKCRQRALDAIDTVGLDGFESAYPRELSGGMRQRVGFARALIVNPFLLLMDEPFSALDTLTAENLKSDLLDIWKSNKTRTKGILFVTHNISEAIMLADRILILSANPGHIQAELKVSLPHPRNERDEQFLSLADEIYRLMTADPTESVTTSALHIKHEGADLAYHLPDADVSELIGLIEELEHIELDGSNKTSMQELAESLDIDLNDFLPLIEMGKILGFIKVDDADVVLTKEGYHFSSLDMLKRKPYFAAHLMKRVELASKIRSSLKECENNSAHKDRFIALLEPHLAEEETKKVLRTVINWGRYAEIFAYDDNSGELNLENPK